MMDGRVEFRRVRGERRHPSHGDEDIVGFPLQVYPARVRGIILTSIMWTLRGDESPITTANELHSIARGTDHLPALATIWTITTRTISLRNASSSYPVVGFYLIIPLSLGLMLLVCSFVFTFTATIYPPC